MTPNEYQQAVLSTAAKADMPLLLGAIGLSGEVGEVNELIKKHFWHGKLVNPHDIALELGDVCWYVAYLANIIGTDFETILQINVDKIKERYPDGFPNKLSECSYINEDVSSVETHEPGHIPW